MKLNYHFLCLLLLFSLHCFADFKSGGDAYKSGDYETAYKEFLPLAKNGDHRAMYALGSMYAGGHGVEQDLTQSFKWFKEAAKYGRPDAMFKLGLIYEEGHGVKANIKRAISWYGKSAKKGYPASQYKLGVFYYLGNGFKQSNIRAYAWLGLASNNNSTEAIRMIEEVKTNMTIEEIDTAKKLLSEFQKKYN